MSGLDQMMQRIEAVAKAQAAEITNKAQAEADAILAEATAAAQAAAAEIAEKSTRDTASRKDRAVYSQEQQRRTALLRAKQEILAEVLEKSYQALLALPEAEYFAFLKKACGRYAQAADGEIVFAKKDLDRLPAGYIEELQAVAKEKGGSLKLSKESLNVDGGFVLVYGGVEENCTVRTLFDARKEALQDEVHRLLFV